jgi:hypothetical protein
MNTNDRREVNEAISAADDAIYYLEKAKNLFQAQEIGA